MENQRRQIIPLNCIIAINQEQKRNLGEDDRVCLCSAESKAAIIACLDGCGGAGAKRYPAVENWTGARISSRLCGNAVYNWFSQNCVAQLGMQGISASIISVSLKQAIDSALDYANSKLSGSSSVVKGSLSKPLPTTLVAALIEQTGIDQLRCLYLWVGDSRGFLFTTKGLRQMTIDDIQGNMDPLENLENDGVLTNVISAWKNYTIHANDIHISTPSVIITATDGCFSYFVSPIEFEGVLLDTLSASNSPNDWERNLIDSISKTASDDFTMEIAIVGFKSFSELKSAYCQRRIEFRANYGIPLEYCKQQSDRSGMLQLWQQYKTFYM